MRSWGAVLRCRWSAFLQIDMLRILLATCAFIVGGFFVYGSCFTFFRHRPFMNAKRHGSARDRLYTIDEYRKYGLIGFGFGIFWILLGLSALSTNTLG